MLGTNSFPLFLSLFLFCLAPALCDEIKPVPAEVKAEIKAIEDAICAHDSYTTQEWIDLLTKHTLPQWVIMVNNNAFEREAFFNVIRAEKHKIIFSREVDRRFVMEGDTLVVYGFNNREYQIAGNDKTHDVKRAPFSETYKKVDGKWMLLFSTWASMKEIEPPK